MGEKVASSRILCGMLFKSCGLKSALHRYVAMLELIKTYFGYNSWATDRTLVSCEQLTPEEYNAPGCSGNGLVGGTLSHLILVQQGWLGWFEKKMDLREAVNIMDSALFATLGEARARWTTVDEETNQFIVSLTDAAAMEVGTFTRMSGKVESHPFWKMLMHTAHHGTHTRAQIIASIRRFGHEPANLDFLNYVMTV
jgi:uncharacterized damage-inducible protein DinB